ncbi:MAG TPA: hypothetical protein VGE41_06710, partial [Verrucomicrobiae bacterium]
MATERKVKFLLTKARILVWLCLWPAPLFSQIPTSTRPEFEKQVEEIFAQLPPVQHHYENVSETEVTERQQREKNYRELTREKKEAKWVAALANETSLAISNRFATLQALLDFAQDHEALVEVWAYPEPGHAARRIPATEMAQIKAQRHEQPTFLTLTFASEDRKPITRRVEFSFRAAEAALLTQQGFRAHRGIQVAAQQVLSARNEVGKLDAEAQWEALSEAVFSGSLPMLEMPQQPRNAQDLFVAFEFEVNEQDQFTRAVRVYRESEIERRVIEEGKDNYLQVIIVKKPGREWQARGFQVRGTTGELVPASNPVPGQDAVELRVRDLKEAQVRRWNVVEFGEPELIREASLAKFSLLNAHIEKRRKEIAVRKSNLDLIAEPIFAGLNIGAGLVLFPFPLGEAARLGYNSAVAPWFIPQIPNVKEMRELFQILAAKEKHPELQSKPIHYLEKSDFIELEKSARQLTDQEVRDYLEHIREEDIRAMLRLPKFQQIDARVSNLLAIMADAGKVSGWTEQDGFQRDVFNSIYFSVTGEISIKNIIAVLAGGKVATPLSGVTLKDLSEGHGAQEAWLQYLNVTVDVRAVLNTIARLSHSSLAGKELKKPFPYAPRLTDLAAYEIRIFGFPLLMFHKRGLLKADYASFTNDYAYGLIGARIVEHFATKEDM